MTDYSSKATAVRGAARQGLEAGTFTIEQNKGGRWAIVMLAAPVAERIQDAIASDAQFDPSKVRGAQARTAARLKIDRVEYDRTSPEGAVETVRRYMRKHPDASRKQAIAALSKKGLHPSTIATQRYLWIKAQEEMEDAE